MNRRPVPSSFVVWGDRQALARIKDTLGAAISRPSAKHDVVLVDLPKPTASLRENRAKLIELAGDEAIVESVFEDEDGVRLYPTGKVQVRFLKPVEPKDLKIFADRHGVTFEKQNLWQPLQAQFASTPGDGRPVSEVVEEISKDKAVASAWPEVLAPFRREE